MPGRGRKLAPWHIQAATSLAPGAALRETHAVTASTRPAEANNGTADMAVPHPPLQTRARTWLLWLTVAALLAWSWGPTEMHKVTNLITDWRNMAEFGAGFLRPNFHDWQAYAWQMVETVQIALWGTALAVFIGM